MQHIHELFDSEKALSDAAEHITNATLETLPASDSDVGQLQAEISNAVHKAMLVGFLSERYTRDCMMDKGSRNNKQNQRDYESLEDFLERRIKKQDFKKIAEEEAEKTGETW